MVTSVREIATCGGPRSHRRASSIRPSLETLLGPKWNAAANDGELIDDDARFGGDRGASKRNYEDGMARAFSRFHTALRDDGRLVIVFANKSPDAWETLLGHPAPDGRPPPLID